MFVNALLAHSERISTVRCAQPSALFAVRLAWHASENSFSWMYFGVDDIDHLVRFDVDVDLIRGLDGAPLGTVHENLQIHGPSC